LSLAISRIHFWISSSIRGDPEPLEDTEAPETLIQFLRDELVPFFLHEGKFVSVKYDKNGNLDLDVT
jgi:hypothetical protein